jgi:hypothetical protein
MDNHPSMHGAIIWLWTAIEEVRLLRKSRPDSDKKAQAYLEKNEKKGEKKIPSIKESCKVGLFF